MKRNEIKNPYLAPQVKVVKVAVERGFAGSGPQSAFFLWLAASSQGNQNLESRELDNNNWGSSTADEWY